MSSPTPSHVSWATHVALNQTHSRCGSHWLKPGHEWPRLEPKWLRSVVVVVVVIIVKKL